MSSASEPLSVVYSSAGKMTTTGGGRDYDLRCDGISYIRSFTSGGWLAKLVNPPITAQFLKDVSLQVHGGEVLGVIGSSGSGKTTLLNVIARRVQGTTGGAIQLNRRPMTERLFQQSGAYVSFKQALVPCLTVRHTLKYQAQLGLSSSLTSKEKSERAKEVMREFELLEYGRRRVEDLSESARRRLLIALHLIRDPLVLLVDEPTKGLDALSAYQLMYDLYQYVKRHNRIAVVGMMMPRSDIYQLFDRVTVLFFGEAVYSGYTKQMPAYFRQIGYPCPATENPAVYYLSLATVDRETSERYVETQEQAVKLIEIFKGHGPTYSEYRGPPLDSNYAGSLPPLSNLGRPSALSKLATLVSRHYATLFGRKSLLVARLLLLPLVAALLSACHLRLTDSPTSPQSRAGLLFNSICAASAVAVLLTASTFSIHRRRFYLESWENLYGGIVFSLSQFIAPIPLDLISVFASSAIIFWGCNMHGGVYPDFLVFAAVLWCSFQFAQLHTMLLLLFVESAFKVASCSVTLLYAYSAISAGFLKSLLTYDDNSGTKWIYYITYALPYRYASLTLHYQQLRNVNTTCTTTADNWHSQTDAEFCRWRSGRAYLDEVFPDEIYSNHTLNFLICFAFVLAAFLVVVLTFASPLPHLIKRKFRHK